LLLATLVVGVAGAVYVTLVAIYARPIADDWGFLGASDHLSFSGYLTHYWDTASDRYSSFALVLVAVRLFGNEAVNVVPLALLTLLWAGASYAVRLGAPRASAGQAAGAGLLATVAICTSTPSLFDTLGWLNSTGFYLAGFTTAVWVVCWALRGMRLWPRRRIVRASAAFALAAICAGFMELVGAVLVLAALLALVSERGTWSHSRDGSESVLAVGIGASAGTAINLLGPGTRLRESAQHAHLSLGAALHTVTHNLSFVYGDIHDGVLVLWLAAGVVTWLLCGPVRGRGDRRRLLVWAGFLLLVPWLVTSALTAWGGSTESGDRSPFRAAFLITGSVTVAAILLKIVVLSLAELRLSTTPATLAALLLTAVGLIALVHKTAPILRAERLRDRAVQLRAESVSRQLRTGGLTIALRPAPLLTVETQAYDLSFEPLSEQPAWIVTFLRGYYDIPSRDTLMILSGQPRSYCLPGVAAPWVGVRSCQELDGGR
jgi:hypothetical protein